MNPSPMDLDRKIRISAFSWLTGQQHLYGDVLPRKLLENGFMFEDFRIPLISPKGIFKPRIMQLPLSITTSPKGPYDDSFGDDGLLVYRYRGVDRMHPDNVGLRHAYKQNQPLIYLHGVVPGRYLAVFPVFIVGDNPEELCFKVAVDDISFTSSDTKSSEKIEQNEVRRAYLTASVKARLHQRGFRERVLDAYRTSCAFCRLRHRELLDAAHIVPDSEPEGRPTVNNGIALCKLHHAALDSFILGITPDFTIKIREDVLSESDGPGLQYGLKSLHDSKLILPSSKGDWPDQDKLAWRYERFLNVA